MKDESLEFLITKYISNYIIINQADDYMKKCTKEKCFCYMTII